MSHSVKPPNETQRLAALYNLHVMDTEAEERFDRITRIAKQLFHVPIALISLVESDRQWFKSKQGLAACETSRDVSFCSHAILKDDIMIVEYASRDNRFCDNPLVLSDPNIKFYLGCPLKIKNMFNVGTLCLIDDKSRQFSQEEQAIMRDLADMVQTELEARHLSTTDELTGLTNRRGFITLSTQAFKLNQRNDSNISLLFFDLDKFKLINDTYGHKEGDEVLKHFSKCLLDVFRDSDIIARLGGDEFCVLCSNLPYKEIDKLLVRLNARLAKIKKPYKIEYSVGYIEHDKEKHQNINDLLKESDDKMYVHKRRVAN